MYVHACVRACCRQAYEVALKLLDLEDQVGHLLGGPGAACGDEEHGSAIGVAAVANCRHARGERSAVFGIPAALCLLPGAPTHVLASMQHPACLLGHSLTHTPAHLL